MKSISRNEIAQLLRDEPDQLIAICQAGDLKATSLTFTLEAIGQIPDLDPQILLGFLAHNTPIVREGAVLGLEALGHTSEIQNALEERLMIEPSPGVRCCIGGLLEDWNDE